MVLRIALLGGVVPATILLLVLLATTFFTGRRASAPTAATSGISRTRPPGIAAGTWAWVLGFALAIPFIHYTSWSWPQVWPKDASARLIHAAGILASWGVVDLLLTVVLPRGLWVTGEGAPRASPRVLGALRWIGRGASVGLIVGVLAHAYLRHVGWIGLALGAAAAAALASLGAAAVSQGQREHHPSLVWGTQFVAALGAVGVLVLGRTATGGQAAAGLAALAASTALALLAGRRMAPGPIAPWLWAGTMAWLLALGVYATGETNIAAAVLIMAAPLGWLLPRRRLDIDLFWKRVPLSLLLAVAWSLACASAAVVLAVLTQSGGTEEYTY